MKINEKKIYDLPVEKAKLFSILPKTLIIKEKTIHLTLLGVKEKPENRITVEVSILVGQEDWQKRKIRYNPKKISPNEAIFLAWALLSHGEYNEKLKHYKEKASTLIEYAIRSKVDSCLPCYLLAKGHLYEEKDFMRSQLVEAANCEDVFPDFYKQLLFLADTTLERVGVARQALKIFPENSYFTEIAANDLFENKKYGDCINFLGNFVTKTLGDRKQIPNDIFVLYFRALLKLENFEKAEKLLEACSEITHSSLGNSSKHFLNGLLYYEWKNYEKAVSCFTEAVYNDLTHYLGDAPFYYLLVCYIKTANLTKVEEMIGSLSKSEDVEFWAGVPWHFYFTYEEIAKEALEQTVKLKVNELVLAQAKGILARYYLLKELPEEDTGNKRDLTEEERKVVEKGLNLIIGALKFYPTNLSYIGIYSNFLYFSTYYNKYDQAMVCAVKYFTGLKEGEYTDPYPYVELKNCSDEFLNNYAAQVRTLIHDFPSITAKDYSKKRFSDDLQTLWKLQKYQTIANLYYWLKEKIDIFAFPDWHEDKGGGPFEISYSLKEIGDVQGAKILYEKYISFYGDDSASLNNLAVIYEGEKNLEKAYGCIKKAKKLTEGDDKIIEINYARIISRYKKERGQSVQKNKGKKIESLNEERKKSSPPEPENKPEILTGPIEIQIPKSPNTLKEENGEGFLMAKNKRIKIGKVSTRKYRLLKYLHPFGTTRTVDSVFDAIRTSKDKENSLLQDEATAGTERKRIIDGTRKEIYRMLAENKLRGILKIQMRQNRVKIEA